MYLNRSAQLGIALGAAALLALIASGSVQASTYTPDDNFGQDLYESLYTKVAHDAETLAVKRIQISKGLTPDELKLIIPGAHIGELLSSPDPKPNLTPEQIEARRQEIQAAYEDELDLADLETGLGMEVSPTEIFANGDEEDSGFDLLTDLDRIEMILFNRSGSGAGGFRFGTGGEDPTSSGISGGGADAPVSSPLPGGGSGGSSDSGGPRTPVRAGNSGGTNGNGGDNDTPVALCPVNPSFNNAAEHARAQTAGDNQGTSGGSGTGGGVGNGRDSGSSSGGRNDDSGRGNQENQTLAPEPAANWGKPRPCDGPFCLRFETVYKTDSSYTVSDNCIACHFEKINDAFKKTFSHNITPSKVTGNLIEGSKCKRAIGDSWLKFNLILVSKPILTPPNDDLIVRGDIIKNIGDFYERYFGSGTLNPVQDLTSNVLEKTSNGSDQKTVLQEIQKQVQALKENQLKLLESTRTAQNAENLALQYDVLLQEITTMKQYFEGFTELYQQLVNAQGGESPCTILLNKDTCS